MGPSGTPCEPRLLASSNSVGVQQCAMERRPATPAILQLWPVCAWCPSVTQRVQPPAVQSFWLRKPYSRLQKVGIWIWDDLGECSYFLWFVLGEKSHSNFLASAVFLTDLIEIRNLKCSVLGPCGSAKPSTCATGVLQWPQAVHEAGPDAQKQALQPHPPTTLK